jgi:hypothetical protein
MRLLDFSIAAADVLEVKLPDNAGEASISPLPVLLGKPPATPGTRGKDEDQHQRWYRGGE